MTATPTSLSADTEKLLRCPRCRSPLTLRGDLYVCSGEECGRSYPLASGGIPVLIDEDQSVFSIATFVAQRPTFFHRLGPVASFLRRFVPEIGANLRSKRNYRTLHDRLAAAGVKPRVLVLGGSILGEGMEALDSSALEVVESDVALGPRTRLICDAHSIPFADGSFDAV